MQTTHSSKFAFLQHGRVLLMLLSLTAMIRMVAIERPLLGNFATKNVVYAMIARNWVMGRADLWHPTLDCLVGDQRGLHMLEFPAAAYMAGELWREWGGSLDAWGRGVSVLFSVASVAVLWGLVSRRHGRVAAGAACLALALSPISVFCGQSFMLESSLVFFLLTAWWAIDEWGESRRWAWLAIYALSLALMLLTKVYAVVYTFPLLLEAWRARSGGRAESQKPAGAAAPAGSWASRLFSHEHRALVPVLIITLLSMVPAGFWYVHAYRAGTPDSPLADHVYYSVHRTASAQAFPNPLLKSPDFYARMLDDLSGPMLTPVGCALVLASLLTGAWRTYWAWLAAAGLLVVGMPGKFFELNYYGMALLPPLCVLIGIGWDAIQTRFGPSRVALFVLFLLALGWSFRYCARPAFVTPAEDQQVLTAAGTLQGMAGPDDRVVTMHGSGIHLLYYCNRPGWAVDPADKDLPDRVAECRSHGARWLVLIGEPPAELKKVEHLTMAFHAGTTSNQDGKLVRNQYAVYKFDD